MVASAPPGFWRLPLRTPGLPGWVNSYLIGHRHAVLVDPGCGFPGELDRLRRRLWQVLGSGGALECILLTHHHPDHVAGARRLSDELCAPVAAHVATLELLEAGVRPRWSQNLDEGDHLKLGPALDLEVLHTPGHAAGHICLFEPRLRVLVGGDMVPGVGSTLVFPEEGEMGTYLASLRRLEALEPELLLPGHGPPRSDAARVIRELIEHRVWREQRVLAALGAHPRSCAEITLDAYADLSPWRLPLAYHSTMAHLLKLESEGRAVRGGTDAWLLRVR